MGRNSNAITSVCMRACVRVCVRACARALEILVYCTPQPVRADRVSIGEGAYLGCQSKDRRRANSRRALFKFSHHRHSLPPTGSSSYYSLEMLVDVRMRGCLPDVETAGLILIM